MLNCFVLVDLLKTITRFLSLPTFHIRVAVAIITPPSLPPSSLLSIVCFHTPPCFIITHSHSFITGLLCPAYTISHFCHGALVHYKYN